MGTPGNNGGERPPEGGGLPEEGPVPDLPPDWGPIVIPSDASSLDEEGAAIRREFRRKTRRLRWRRRLHLAPPVGHDEQPGLAVPLFIMSIAVVATLVSLFAVAWPGSNGRSNHGPFTGATVVASTANAASAIAELVFVEPSGAHVRLGSHLPAVVLLVDGCTCQVLISETARAVRAPVNVFAVGTAVPTYPASTPDPVPVRIVADPTRAVRAAVPGLAGTTEPAAVLIGRTGTVLRTVPRVRSVDDFRTDLAALAA